MATLSVAGPITRFLQGVDARASFIDLSSLISLLSVVIVIALFVGVSYAIVAIPAQTQLQEDLPEEVRGRVFGVLNMLVSVASFLPIIIVGPIADLVGTSSVLLVIGILVLLSGIGSVLSHRGTTVPDGPADARRPCVRAGRPGRARAPFGRGAAGCGRARESGCRRPARGRSEAPHSRSRPPQRLRDGRGERCVGAGTRQPGRSSGPTQPAEPAAGSGRRLRSVRMRVARRKDNTSAP